MTLRNESSLLYKLKLVSQELTNNFEKSTNFSLTRFEMMHVLHEHNTCSQTFLQSCLKIDSAAITRHLKILEDTDYVTRERNKENNREVLITITEKAKHELEDCNKKHQHSLKSLIGELSDSEQIELLQLLNKITK